MSMRTPGRKAPDSPVFGVEMSAHEYDLMLVEIDERSPVGLCRSCAGGCGRVASAGCASTRDV